MLLVAFAVALSFSARCPALRLRPRVIFPDKRTRVFRTMR
jgi:hypothetical protein